MIRRTPAWADLDLLRSLEKLYKIVSAITGFQFSMDHIVPLNHELVCGLHCPDNIDLVLLEVNQAKGNKWWPDMPEIQLELL